MGSPGPNRKTASLLGRDIARHGEISSPAPVQSESAPAACSIASLFGLRYYGPRRRPPRRASLLAGFCHLSWGLSWGLEGKTVQLVPSLHGFWHSTRPARHRNYPMTSDEAGLKGADGMTEFRVTRGCVGSGVGCWHGVGQGVHGARHPLGGRLGGVWTEVLTRLSVHSRLCESQH